MYRTNRTRAYFFLSEILIMYLLMSWHCHYEKYFFFDIPNESRKKSYFLKGLAIKKKEHFLGLFYNLLKIPNKLEGGLYGTDIKKITFFCGFPNA